MSLGTRRNVHGMMGMSHGNGDGVMCDTVYISKLQVVGEQQVLGCWCVLVISIE